MARGDTRERILGAALELFNQEGEPHASTNRIADSLDISPGNLHYHFRTKAELTETLFARFESRMLELLSLPEEAEPDIEQLWLFLHLVFETIATHRFIYRDLTDLCSRNRKIALRMRGILKLSLDTADGLCRALSSSGKMHASSTERRALVRNIVLASTFWLAFDTVLEPERPERPDRAVWQVMSLLAPYLEPDSREQLQLLAASYLPDQRR